MRTCSWLLDSHSARKVSIPRSRAIDGVDSKAEHVLRSIVWRRLPASENRCARRGPHSPRRVD